jgi:hypothetical protein
MKQMERQERKIRKEQERREREKKIFFERAATRVPLSKEEA